MMKILDLTMRDDRICTMALAFTQDSIGVVRADLKFDGNRLAVDISVPDGGIAALFEEEIRDFFYHYKKNGYEISSFNVRSGPKADANCDNAPSVNKIKEKWLKVMDGDASSRQLDVFA